MKTKTTKFGLVEGVSPEALEIGLICKQCKFSSLEGRGEYWQGYHEYFVFVCKKMEKDKYGDREPLNDEGCISAPTEEFPNGYMELITACDEFLLKPSVG